MIFADAKLNRRVLLSGALAAAMAVPAWGEDAPLGYPFTLGVASGDPWPDGFVIWTRLAPQPLLPHGGMPMTRPSVRWEVAADEAFRTIVASGQELALPEFAHALHVEAKGLEPGRPYWYRFAFAGDVSPVGRTRTSPAPGAALANLTFAAVGCQNYQDGYYTAHRRLSEEPVDFVFHYGDYIYENQDDPDTPKPRSHLGDECESLDDYRQRYAQYRMDPDLQAAHAAAPWFAVYDDHEVSNNWAGQFDRFGSSPETFALRRAMAMQAWYEHMPLRGAQCPELGAVQIFRRAQYGNLLSAHFLDTRLYRTDQPCGDGFKTYCPGIDAPDAQMISPGEEQWLTDSIAGSQARWNMIAQQVMMLELDRRKADADAPLYNVDSWAGYRTPRQRLLARLGEMNRGNIVVLTGDEHQNFANELRLKPNDRKSPIVAHEFVATSISSGGDGPAVRPEHAAILAHNPDCRMINDKRGYLLCEVTPAHWRATFKILDKVSTPGGKLSTHASYVVEHGAKAMARG